MHFKWIALTALLLPSALCLAQARPVATDDGSSSAEATTNDTGPAGIIPYAKGYNVSLGATSQHDSANGWSSLLTPDVAYRFNGHFSADFSIPLFTYINVLVTSGTKAAPVYTLTEKNHVFGDASLNGHYETSFSFLDYNATATLGLPTGDDADGLGAGQVTYFLNNHFEKSIGIFAPDIELGIGDSSSLTDARVRRDYTSVGQLAHFQAGISVFLPRHINFSADAYEDLPLSSQIVYSTTGKGRKKKTTATNEGVAEDNGFLNTLDIPLNRHVTLSGFYNRSLRSHIDTVGFSSTFMLKGPPKNVAK